MRYEMITIAGNQFRVPSPYEEGHPCTVGEAAALNQTLHENIRNNLAKKAKDGELTQEDVDEYAEGYEFGVGRKIDPIEQEAVSIAINAIKNKIKATGGKIADYTTAQLREMADKAIEANPKITELARKRVEEQQALGALTLEGVE